jgi:hypothetical protein
MATEPVVLRPIAFARLNIGDRFSVRRDKWADRYTKASGTHADDHAGHGHRFAPSATVYVRNETPPRD